MLAHRLRHWANINPAIGYRVVFAGHLGLDPMPSMGDKIRNLYYRPKLQINSFRLITGSWMTEIRRGTCLTAGAGSVDNVD